MTLDKARREGGKMNMIFSRSERAPDKFKEVDFVADTTVKHYIVMRFFPKQKKNYPHNVLDVEFLQKHTTLAANNALKSLANQTNKNFEIVFLMHPRTFVDESYKFIFDTLTEASPVPVHFPKNYNAFIEDAYAKYDFVIQSRMDFDDFLHKDAVADTQNQVDNCENILLYGYCKGYLYWSADGVLHRMFYPSRGIGHLGILQSFIWKSSFARQLPTIGPYFSGAHHKMKIRLKEFLEKNGVEFSESMFQQNTTMNAFIYYRHEFSHFTVLHDGNSNDPWIVYQGEVTADEMTRKQLEEDYGFTYELKSIE